jgi:alkaline phosphatase D
VNANRCLLIGLAAVLVGVGWSRPQLERSRAARKPVITHGVATGDVSATTAVVWSRANMAARMHVQVSRSARVPRRARQRTARATVSSDFTAKVKLTGLRPGTMYFFRVWFSRKTRVSSRLGGSFRTAPAASVRARVSFVTSGDLGGQTYCRNAGQGGYGILAPIARLAPDAFILNGDAIYADDECPSQGPSGWQNIPAGFPSVADHVVDWQNRRAVRQVYLAHWRYNRADAHFRRLLRGTPLYSLWDDHEVINDFGSSWPQYPPDPTRQGYPNLVLEGRKAFALYGVIGGPTIYRSFRWGRDVELFILDCRSYRSLNQLPDAPGAKTMLGADQRAWLLDRVRSSTATWKLVVSGAALSIASGPDNARDGWANGLPGNDPAFTGFERELGTVLSELDRANVRNLVFVSGDVHQARQLRYNGDYDQDGDRLLFHELVSGPLAAGPGAVRIPDPTFGPVQIFAEGGLFNFGYVRVSVAADGTPHLFADVRDEAGAVRPGSRLELAPQ